MRVRLARVVVAAEPAIVLAVAPALLFPTPTRVAVLVVIPAIWLCAWIVGDPIVPPTPLNAALWLMLIMVGVSMHATFDVRFSLGKISGLILGILLFWSITRWLTNSDRLKFAAATFVLAGVVLAVLGLLGSSGPWFDKYPVIGAMTARLPHVIRGVPGAENGFNPNAVAGVLVLFVPVQVGLLATGAHRWWLGASASRWASRGLVALQVLLLFLTAGTVLLMQSRGAWMGLAVATVAFLFWYSRPTRVLAVSMMAVTIVLAATYGPRMLSSLDASRPGPGGPGGNILGRIEIWTRALEGIQRHPVTGIGMNAFRKVMPGLAASPLADIVHSHNNLLQAALDLGLPGLVAYLSIWMLTGVLLVRTYSRSHEPVIRGLAGGVAGGLIAHFMFGVADAIPLGAKVGVLFWLTLALSVGLHRVALAGPPQRIARSA